MMCVWFLIENAIVYMNERRCTLDLRNSQLMIVSTNFLQSWCKVSRNALFTVLSISSSRTPHPFSLWHAACASASCCSLLCVCLLLQDLLVESSLALALSFVPSRALSSSLFLVSSACAYWRYCEAPLSWVPPFFSSSTPALCVAVHSRPCAA